MKSIIMRIFLVFLLSISITACSVNKDKSKPTSASKSSATTELNTNTSTTTSFTTSDSKNDNVLTNTPSDITNNAADIALKAYKAVLQNKSEFYNTNANKDQKINDFLANNGVYGTVFKTLHFAVIDMDGDKTPEVVIELAVGGNNYAEFYEVFHYKDDKVYGYIFSNRQLGGLKSDGTFGYSSGAADNGFGKLRFHDSNSVIDSIGYEASKNNNQDEVYFIDNNQVTSDKYEAFQKEQEAKKDVTWYDFSQNNMDKQLTNTKINYNEDLCADNEEVLYSFKIENSSKVLSLCVSKTQPDYMVYRFGTKDNIELEYPDNKESSREKFAYSHISKDGSDNYYLIFDNGGYSYKIYEIYNVTKDAGRSAGVVITSQAMPKQTVITGISSSIKGTMKNLVDNRKLR